MPNDALSPTAHSCNALIALGVFAALAPVGALGQELSELPMRELGYNNYGVGGLVETPSAFGHEDAEFAVVVSHFGQTTRTGLSFQITPRLTGAFRYASLQDFAPSLGGSPRSTYFDRSFALQYRLLNEGDYRPALAVGMNDIIGTGVYGSEYLVASKHFGPRVSASVGIGWGRLGSYKGFTNPLGALSKSFETRPAYNGQVVGQLEASQWFRGDAALFGGVQWQASDKLRLTAEYSSDAYLLESQTRFDHKSPFNFGATYKVGSTSQVSAQYLYGSEVGLNWAFVLNPRRSNFGSGFDAAPQPFAATPKGRAAAQSWGQADQQSLEARLTQRFKREGLRLDAVSVEGAMLRVQFSNERYLIASQALGRAARVLSHEAPAGVQRFDLRLSTQGMSVTSVVVPRGELAKLEFHPVAPDLLRAQTRISDAPVALEPMAARYPRFSGKVEPKLRTSLFDPDDPLRADVAANLRGRAELGAGFVVAGTITQRLTGNLDQITRESDSVLPHVRSDGYLYEKFSGTSLTDLTGAYYFRAGDDLYGRVTLGYLERMFGGVSTELLWKAQNSRLALGVELNEVRQRAFDSYLGFGDYGVTTGHVSAYYDLGNGYETQVDIGRYLAGDVGATFALDRTFDNGWRVGAYMTKTDVSAADYGEGSFDKGLRLTIPLAWIDGRPTTAKLDTVIQSLQRDGGAKVQVAGRLYETVRGMQATELDASWGRFYK